MESRHLSGAVTGVTGFFRSRYWRVPATGAAFATFGVVGSFLSLTIYPLLIVLPVARARRAAWARGIIGFMFRSYLRLLNLFGLISYDIRNADQLREPSQLIIANHPSLLDVVFLMALTPANCVVKASLWRNPFTALAVRAANYIPNNAPDLYQRCLDTLARGECLIIFPEGTRTVPGQPLKFQRGPAYIAMGAECVIRPVAIWCEPATLLKNVAWYSIPATPPHFTIHVLPALETDITANDELPSQVARRINKFWQGYFAGVLAADHRST